jgi:branched-chain amino acid transport system substrate-binding protein
MNRPSCFTVILSAFLLSFVGAVSGMAQQPQIKIGFIYPTSGPQANWGTGARQGAELALDELNSAGGILGRKVVGLFEDTQLKPEAGVRVAKKLGQEERVDVLIGIVSSAVAVEVTKVMPELRIPLIISLAMTPDATGRFCNPYTFRVSMNGPQNIKCAAALAAEMKAKKWSTIGPDYLFGYQCWEYFKKFLTMKVPIASFVSDSDAAFISMEETDFSRYIKKALSSKPEGILVSLYGKNLRDFIRQGQEMGIFDGQIEFLMNLAYSNDVLRPMRQDMPKGLWFGGLYWFQAVSNPENYGFVNAYFDRFKAFPDLNPAGAYAAVKVYAEAVKKANSTKTEDVIKALEGLTMDLPQGRVTIRAEDHQAIYDGVWGQTGEYVPKWSSRLLSPIRIFPASEIAVPINETGCARTR